MVRPLDNKRFKNFSLVIYILTFFFIISSSFGLIYTYVDNISRDAIDAIRLKSKETYVEGEINFKQVKFQHYYVYLTLPNSEQLFFSCPYTARIVGNTGCYFNPDFTEDLTGKTVKIYYMYIPSVLWYTNPYKRITKIESNNHIYFKDNEYIASHPQSADIFTLISNVILIIINILPPLCLVIFSFILFKASKLTEEEIIVCHDKYKKFKNR